MKQQSLVSTAYAVPETGETIRPMSPVRDARFAERWSKVFFWTVVSIAGFLAAFVFPFLFPLKQAVFSPAYTVGGNNRVGAFAVAAVAMLTAAACLRFSIGPRGLRVTTATAGPGRPQLWLSVGIVVTFSAVLSILVVRSGLYYADAGYFITQLRSGLVFHRALYREVEFAYGPLLYLWPAMAVRALGHFGWSLKAAYMASLVLLEALGTVLLYWTVAAMPMSRRMKMIAFALLVVLTLDPQAGLNYTAFRFILPTFGLVFLSKQQRLSRAAMAAFFTAALNFAVSPELGVAFTAGAICYGLYLAMTANRRWLVVSASSIVGAACFGVAMGPEYFRTMAEFAKGGYNEILAPGPHIYVLLACAVILAPMAVAAALRDGWRQKASGRMVQAGLLLGIFVVGLAMLAPALGRCDPLHVSFNGWALFLLACIAVDQMGKTGHRAWLTVAVLFCVYTLGQEYMLEKGSLVRVLLHRPDPFEDADLPRLIAATNGQRIAFPVSQAGALIDTLTAKNLYEPQYLCIPAIDAHAEQRTVQDMRRANYALIPNDGKTVGENEIHNVGMRYHLRLNYRYKARRKPYLQGALTVAELQQHWQPQGVYGSYTLYRKIN